MQRPGELFEIEAELRHDQVRPATGPQRAKRLINRFKMRDFCAAFKCDARRYRELAAQISDHHFAQAIAAAMTEG